MLDLTIYIHKKIVFLKITFTFLLTPGKTGDVADHT